MQISKNIENITLIIYNMSKQAARAHTNQACQIFHLST